MKREALVYVTTKNKNDLEEQMVTVQNFARYRFSLKEICNIGKVRGSKTTGKTHPDLVQDMKTNGVENLIVPSLESFSRNPDTALAALKFFTSEGIAVYSAEGDFIDQIEDSEKRRESLLRFITYMEQYREKIRSNGSKKKGGKRKRGLGRPRILNAGQREALIALRRSGSSVGKICTKFNVSRSTVSKILAAHPELKGVWKGTKKKTEQA
ncbi:MAG: helix-turn-helix domain-containing protein [Methanomicrobiales archaeon]|nr:helix-turn-helix domain-containing protein [Methanomicrobiales archaeon]